MTVKKCIYCKRDYKNYNSHLKSKRHIKNSNKPNIKISHQDLKNVNIKLILNELLEPENNDMEYIKQQLKLILDIM